MRLIDADALEPKKITLLKPDGDCLFLACYDVQNAPTIDAVPVVRCGDCRWYDPRTKNCLDGLYGVFEPDWFCKDGQRREGKEPST